MLRNILSRIGGAGAGAIGGAWRGLKGLMGLGAVGGVGAGVAELATDDGQGGVVSRVIPNLWQRLTTTTSPEQGRNSFLDNFLAGNSKFASFMGFIHGLLSYFIPEAAAGMRTWFVQGSDHITGIARDLRAARPVADSNLTPSAERALQQGREGIEQGAATVREGADAAGRVIGQGADAARQGAAVVGEQVPGIPTVVRHAVQGAGYLAQGVEAVVPDYLDAGHTGLAVVEAGGLAWLLSRFRRNRTATPSSATPPPAAGAATPTPPGTPGLRTATDSADDAMRVMRDAQVGAADDVARTATRPGLWARLRGAFRPSGSLGGTVLRTGVGLAAGMFVVDAMAGEAPAAAPEAGAPTRPTAPATPAEAARERLERYEAATTPEARAALVRGVASGPGEVAGALVGSLGGPVAGTFVATVGGAVTDRMAQFTAATRLGASMHDQATETLRQDFVLEQVRAMTPAQIAAAPADIRPHLTSLRTALTELDEAQAAIDSARGTRLSGNFRAAALRNTTLNIAAARVETIYDSRPGTDDNTPREELDRTPTVGQRLIAFLRERPAPVVTPVPVPAPRQQEAEPAYVPMS